MIYIFYAHQYVCLNTSLSFVKIVICILGKAIPELIILNFTIGIKNKFKHKDTFNF